MNTRITSVSNVGKTDTEGDVRIGSGKLAAMLHKSRLPRADCSDDAGLLIVSAASKLLGLSPPFWTPTNNIRPQ